MPDSLDLVTQREFDQQTIVVNKSIEAIERRLEAGVETFQKMQSLQDRQSVILEQLQKNQEKVTGEIQRLLESEHPLHSRLVAVETKMALMAEVPTDLHNIKLALLDLTATVRERESAKERSENKLDSWKQALVKISIPLLFALGGYLIAEWISLHDSHVITQHVQQMETGANKEGDAK